MAKYRAPRAGRAKSKNREATSAGLNVARAIPCLVMVVGVLALFAILFYSTLQQAR